MALYFTEESYKDFFNPLPVSGHKILLHEASGCLYLVGGWNPRHEDNFDGDSNNFDLHYVRQAWRYNLARKVWTKLKSENAPMSMASHCCAWLNEHQILLYGGSLSTKGIAGNSNKTYAYDINTQQWTKLNTGGTPCPELCGHWFGQAMCRRGHEIFVVTGILDSMLKPGCNRVHSLNLHTLTWTNLSGQDDDDQENFAVELLDPVIRPRVRHDVVVHGDDLVLIGGGKDFRTACYNMKDLPTFDVKNRKWKLLATKPDPTTGEWPAPRQCQSCVQSGSKVYICGGYCHLPEENAPPEEWFATGRVLKDLWCLDLSFGTWTQLPADLPHPLWFHGASLDSQTQIMYILGGCTDAGYAERSNALYTISVKNDPQKLEYICWQFLLRTYDHFSPLSGPCPSDYVDSLNRILPAKLLRKLLC